MSVEDVDFLNPRRQEDGRECGVRLELRIAETDADPGSIYVSRAVSVGRGVCRVDLLETAPNAQDRMHWHPQMSNGEPSQRVFEVAMREDPLAWLGAFLRDGVETLRRAGVEQPERYREDAEALSRIVDLIVADVAGGLERFRAAQWTPVSRDERGMALTG